MDLTKVISSKERVNFLFEKIDRLTLPTFILERRSLLEMYADFFGKFCVLTLFAI